MELKANNDNMFSVPCVVVDNLLQMASGEHIKVLLYILRRIGRDFAENEISDETGVSQEEVNNAIDFWRKAKVLTGRPEGNTQPVKPTEEKQIIENQMIENQMTFEQITENQEPMEQAVPENPPVQKKRRYKSNLSAADIAEIKTSDSEMADLFEIIENSLGILNHHQANLIIDMHNRLGLKKEVIIILINYCKTIKKTSPNYIEKIAENWSENNINTLEFAQKEAERLLSTHEYTSQVKRITDTRRISKNDEAVIEQWQKWDIPLELVEKAYDSTIGQIHDLSFPYMNKIISSWHENGVKDLQGVDEKNKPRKKKSTGRKKVHNDDDFDVDMYKIFINDFEVI